MLFPLPTFLRSSPPPNFMFSISVSKNKENQNSQKTKKLKQNKMRQTPTTKTTHGVCLDGVQSETSKYWVLIGMPSSNPSPQASGISVEGEAERVVKSQRRWVTTKETVSSRHNMTRAYMSSETVTTQVQDSQTPLPKGTSRHKVPPQSGNSVQLITARKGKVSFLRWKVTGYSNHTLRQAPCPGAITKHTGWFLSQGRGNSVNCHDPI